MVSVDVDRHISVIYTNPRLSNKEKEKSISAPLFPRSKNVCDNLYLKVSYKTGTKLLFSLPIDIMGR